MMTQWHEWPTPGFRPGARALLAAACFLAGCGGSGQSPAETVKAGASPAASAAIDPCALVTKSEAETALGGAVAEAERPPEANIPARLATCRYVAQRGQAVAVMTVMVRQGESESESRIGFGQARDQFPAAEAVTGLGMDAFWIGNQLNVLQGRVYLNITGDFDQATARMLAATALTRL
jgi:hypothetical protein